MIEYTKLQQELEDNWPMAKEGTSQKWKIIYDTQDALAKIANIRAHTPAELEFLSNYHEAINSVDKIIINHLDTGYYEHAYLPYEFALKFKKLYEDINHN